ncbi:tetratricopeptide repeat protein [Sulfurimonas paralvinellae]|uniref:Tetratricopeptide repeat protein n=1 Tax=Sulfurimonas paralvinellae TaxID=317658 RepID=A0A7M1B970_9BACT|nr:tetratricopeptide repeat protein [Sulfurimonas paralvinellae]QOP46273.1 tetratricopeptide repeat protein [Sulfurimonas paralvinellae]
MADAPEDIIIIEDSDAASYDSDSGYSSDEYLQEEEAKRKKIILFGGLAIIVVLIIAITIILLTLKSSKEHSQINITAIDKKIEASKQKPTLEPSKLENMIAKANYLYASGSKEKALTLYEQIASYSEAVSDYNLGVAELKEKQFEKALQSFQKAIANDEKRCVSAINAAVCCLHLQDKENFKYYIDLAYAYLPYEIESPLYSYYYTLISYYNKNYLAALNSLKNATSHEYPNVQNHLSAKINALYENDYDAIEAMERKSDEPEDFSLGLLYARIGDFSLASNHLEAAISKETQPVRAPLALGLVNLKAGHIAKAAKKIKEVTEKYPQEVYKYYPVKVKLKESLFDPQKAQQNYRHKIQHSKNVMYQKIFYFSPYKIFNANQTISYIRKGNANIYIDNVKSAKEYLKKSASSSSVNIGIVKAIKKALSFKIREANEDLQKLVKLQPKHSILQYNLALTYAQMGNLKKAHEHFLRSYYLDAKNYLSGIYAVMTAQLINVKYYKLKSIIKDSIALEEDGEDVDLYKTLLHLSEGDYLSAVEWLDRDYKQRPLYLALDILIATKLSKMDKSKESANKLLLMQPNDILPNIIYMDTEFADLKTSEYAKETLKYLKEHSFTYDDLYYGPYITRYLFIQENLISGRLYFLRKQLKEVLETTNQDTRDIESSLALVSLYSKEFEESYTLYNHLIDELKVRDAYTLYLGAVASTAAGHHENAIALLELAKMKDGSFYESRYALALLYMEINNNDGAVIQLSRIQEDGFQSQYFEFMIDTDKLLFQKQHPQKK